MPELLYFCELLINIQQVSVSIDSQDVGSQPFSINLHPSRRALTFTSRKQNSDIILPIRVEYASKSLNSSYSHRLPVSPSYLTSESFKALFESPPIPWDATSLGTENSLHCATCATRIVPALRIREWKNLPSEHWADLMDLWHCHKPHDEGTNTEGGKYSSLARITAQKCTGLVDQLYFLLHREDCENVFEQQTELNEAETVVCNSCSSPIGIVDSKVDGIRIMKWFLSVGRRNSTTNEVCDNLETFSVYQWLSAQFLYLVENSGQRKFLVQAGANILKGSDKRVEESGEGLHVWIFNPSTLITTSRRPSPTRALKIYYRELVSKTQVEELGDIETVYLPRSVYQHLKNTLGEENASLPRDIRIWAAIWKTAWLERF